MDFNLSREQEMLRSMAREFAEKEVAPVAQSLDEKGEFPHDLVRKRGQLGLMGLVTPKEYGGSAMGHLARNIAIEEVSRAFASLGFYMQTGGIGLYLLDVFGTEEQKKQRLPALCRADKIIGFALTEPSGGSDPSALQTTAEPAEGGYVLNGRKVFITMAEVADTVVVITKMGQGFGAFMVDKGKLGFEITRRETHFGLRGMPVNEFVLNNCLVPKESLLGAEGRGLIVGITGISVMGRLGAAAVALGVAQSCYEIALKHAKERKLFGKPIGELEAIQFMLVDMSTQIEAARLLTYKPSQALDEGKNPRDLGADIARSKLYATDVAIRVAENAVRILGGYGTTPEYQLVRRLRDAIELLPGAGSPEVMKVTIGRAILG